MRILLLITFLFLNQIAFAENPPKTIVAALKGINPLSVKFNKGVLKIVLSQQVVNAQMYEVLVDLAVCHQVYDYPNLAKKIKSVEIFNNTTSQGFAFDGGGKSCMEMINMTADQTSKHIQKMAIQCVTGVCRK